MKVTLSFRFREAYLAGLKVFQEDYDYHTIYSAFLFKEIGLLQ